MARRASRTAYASDVSACFPARIAGLVLAVADAQPRGLEHFAPPRHRRRLRRSYRPRRLVGQRAAATGGRSAQVAEDAGGPVAAKDGPNSAARNGVFQTW